MTHTHTHVHVSHYVQTQSRRVTVFIYSSPFVELLLFPADWTRLCCSAGWLWGGGGSSTNEGAAAAGTCTCMISCLVRILRVRWTGMSPIDSQSHRCWLPFLPQTGKNPHCRGSAVFGFYRI